MSRSGVSREQQLRDEVDRLNHQLLEKDRLIDGQMNSKKSEWAEIYANQKQDLDSMTQENSQLRADIARLKMDLVEA